MTKAPTTTGKPKKQCDNTQTPSKTSITQRLPTDLGRSVGVTIATQLCSAETIESERGIYSLHTVYMGMFAWV